MSFSVFMLIFIFFIITMMVAVYGSMFVLIAIWGETERWNKKRKLFSIGLTLFYVILFTELGGILYP